MKSHPSSAGGSEVPRAAPALLALLGAALVVAALLAWPADPRTGSTALASDRTVPASSEPGPQDDVLAHQAEHDQRLAREANRVLDEILGPGRARITVRSAWDFARHTTSSERPGRRVVLHESRTTGEPPAEGTPALREEKEWSAARSSEERVDDAPRLERLSVALFLDEGAPDSPELRAALQAAVGFDERRGDEFRTVVLPFARPPAPAAGPTGASPGLADPLGRWGLALAGAGALTWGWLALRRRRRVPPFPTAVPAPAPPHVAPGTAPSPAARERVEELLGTDPGRVGAVLSRWAREEPVESAR